MSPQFDPYLFFPGTCADAMRFYEKTLGAKVKTMMTHDQMPAMPGGPPMAPGSEHLVMHCTIELDGRVLMASDWISPHPYPGIHGVAIALNYADVAEAKRIFTALSDGGSVLMPMDKTFWIEAFGMTTDRFGTPWMVNGGAPAPMPG